MESFFNKSISISLPSIFELSFFSVLYQVSKRMTIYLSIPETFIFGYGFERPMLICSDQKNNELCFEENLSPIGLHEGFVYFKEIAYHNAPIAILKTQPRSHDKCEVLYSVKECQSVWDNHVKSGKRVCIQKFIFTGKIPKLIKSSYSIDDHSKKMKVLTKNTKLTDKISKLLPNLKRTSTLKLIEGRANIIREKEECNVNEVLIDYSLQSQEMNLVKVIEKFYSSNKDCKVQSMLSNWVCDLNENFYLLSLKTCQLVNIVYKPLQMNGSGYSHKKSSSMEASKDFIVIARGEKKKTKLREYSINKNAKSSKRVRYLERSINKNANSSKGIGCLE